MEGKKFCLQVLVFSLTVTQLSSRRIEKGKLNKWLDKFNRNQENLGSKWSLGMYKYFTNITSSNAQTFTRYEVAYKEWLKRQVKQSKEFRKQVSKSESPSYRMLRLISAGVALSKKREVNQKITQLGADLQQIYGTTKVNGSTVGKLAGQLKKGSYKKKLGAWQSWRDAVGPSMRKIFPEFVKLLNQAASESGFSHYGDSWREMDYGYETNTNDLEATAEKIFKKVQPLYRQLHAYVRRKLHEQYPDKVSLTGPIPAHLLGNMWGQDWSNVDANILPFPEAEKFDITPTLKKQKFNVTKMFKLAESFYTSLGFANMTDIFWKESMLTRPDDRMVQCTAAAFNLLKKDDFRISMCTKVNQQHLNVIHHEMGHIVYYMQYAHQPTIFRMGANAAFHEGLGDCISLSVDTPQHYKKIGLLEDTRRKEPKFVTDQELNFLMKLALSKVVFLPYAYLLGKYRWDMFKGAISHTNYNSKWWEMREAIQGLVSPVARTEEHFDPGAKFHIAANQPYIRYFYAGVAQFQFFKSLCAKSKHSGFLHRCDFYQSEAAGQLLSSVLSLGQSVPWQDAMEKLTKQRNFSIEPMLEYFKPLYNWLEKKNKREHIGW